MPRGRKANALRVIAFLLRAVAPYRWQWLGLLLLSLVVVGTAVSEPLILKFLIDDVISPGLLVLLLPVLLAYLTVQVLSLTLAYAYGVLKERFIQQIVIDVRNTLFAQIEYKQLAFFSERQVGDLMRTLTTDIDSVNLLLSAGERVAVNVLRLVLVLGVVLVLSWQVALLLLVMLPLYVAVQMFYTRRLRQSAEQLTATDVQLVNFLQERLSNMLLIKMFAQEQRELRSERAMTASVGARNVGLVRDILRSTIFVSVVTVVALVATVGMGGAAVIAGGLALGGFIAIYAYTVQVFGPAASLAGIPSSLQGTLVSARRLYDILSSSREEEEVLVPPVRTIRGEIHFKNVSFAYPQHPKTPILRNVSFHIAPGETVGITGQSGSGKTTLLLLLLRFYEPTRGEIYLDGHPLKKYPRSFLRKHIGVVPQTSLFFPGTVAQNISYARPGSRPEDIRAAARLASIHERIAALPHGYATELGTDGAGLSEGEKQRLAIARVFLRAPDVFIFDEPTSALDFRNEDAVKASIRSVRKEKTTMIIAHRRSTLEFVDRILNFSRGRLLKDTYPQPRT